MGTTAVEWGVLMLYLYLAAGTAFAVPFALRWVNRIDANAERGSWGFRLLIVPGSIALWPLLARRALARQTPREKSPHRDAARGGA
jgi:hypothetical protein